MNARLSQDQQVVLDELATRMSANFWSSVSGIDLRKAAPGASLEEKTRIVESLCPELVVKVNSNLKDQYGITLTGLLASSQGDAARRWFELVLRLLHDKYDAEGAFRYYTWRELRERADSDDDNVPGLVDAVLDLGKLANGKFSDQGDDIVQWMRPDDIELLLEVNDVGQLLALRKKQAEDAAQAAEDKLNVNLIARRILQVFGHGYEELGRRNFSMIPQSPAFDDTRLSMKGRIKGFERLRDVGLLKFMGTNRAATLTPAGVGAIANQAELDRALPLPGSPLHSPPAALPPNQSVQVLDLLDLLDFISDHDAGLGEIIGSDLRELDGALNAGLWKASLLLSGSVLEAILIDVLDRRRDLAGTYLKHRKFPDDASLDDLLKIAGDAELIGDGKVLLTASASQKGNALKDHRDLIHPHRLVRERIEIDEDVARLMLHLLRLVVRDLSKAAKDGVIEAYEQK